MLLEKELDEQGNPIEDDHSDEDEGGGAAGKTVKVGDVEYTTEQLAELANKAKGYDALLPEFTRKSQDLAKLEQAAKPKEEDLPSYRRKDWKPETMEDLAKSIEEAEERGMKRALGTLEERQDAANKAKQDVDDFVAEIKKSDKEFDEQDFFAYAAKHKFPIKTVDDLRAVHSSYDELQKTADDSKDEGRKGKEGRRSKVNNPSGGNDGGPNFTDIRTSGKSILDTAMEAFDRMKK